MRAAPRFLQIVHRRVALPPVGGAALTFGGSAMFFDAVPLTFQPV
jgi:hypothetical protein